VEYDVDISPDTEPARFSLRPTTPEGRKIIEEHTAEMLQNDIIKGCLSPWCHAAQDESQK
jgi:hypothetical protein